MRKNFRKSEQLPLKKQRGILSSKLLLGASKAKEASRPANGWIHSFGIFLPTNLSKLLTKMNVWTKLEERFANDCWPLDINITLSFEKPLEKVIRGPESVLISLCTGSASLSEPDMVWYDMVVMRINSYFPRKFANHSEGYCWKCV